VAMHAVQSCDDTMHTLLTHTITLHNHCTRLPRLAMQYNTDTVYVHMLRCIVRSVIANVPQKGLQ
jgi:hypothetical protein